MFFRVYVYIGLNLLLACRSRPSIPVIPDTVTYHQHIAPILAQSCVSCHRHDGVAPFPLDNYTYASRKGKTILNVIQSGYMPPWPADTSYSHFIGEKTISDFEKKLITKWIETGLQEGEKSNEEYTEKATIVSRRKADTVIYFKNTFKIKGDNRDKFLLMKIPLQFPPNTYSQAIEFVPDNKKLIHHVNTHLIYYDHNKKNNIYAGIDYLDHEGLSGNSKDYHTQLGILHDDGSYPLLAPSVCNYLPGMESVFYPDDIGGFALPERGAFYLNDLHYGPSTKDTLDNSYFKIYYAKNKPKRPLKEFQIGTLGKSPVRPPLIIPANEIDTFTIDYILPDTISLLSIIPHMHLLGSYFEAYAILQNNKKIPLIRIPKWNFRWQYVYTFPTIKVLPKGTQIHVIGIFDNTENNPLNPHHPPQIIIEREGSMRTTDEMFQFLLLYIDYHRGDENKKLD